MAKYITLDNLKVFLDSIATWMKEKYTKKDELEDELKTKLKTINDQSIVGSGNITIINSETDLTNYFVDDSYYINNDGNVSFKNIEADGDLTTCGNLNVELNSTILGDLKVQGTTTMGNMTISEDNDKNTTISTDKITLAATQTHIENTVYSEGGKIIGLDSANGNTTWEIDNTDGSASFTSLQVGNQNVTTENDLTNYMDLSSDQTVSGMKYFDSVYFNTTPFVNTEDYGSVMMATKNDIPSITITPLLDSGTEIAKLNINGQPEIIYAPSPNQTSVDWSAVPGSILPAASSISDSKPNYEYDLGSISQPWDRVWAKIVGNNNESLYFYDNMIAVDGSLHFSYDSYYYINEDGDVLFNNIKAEGDLEVDGSASFTSNIKAEGDLEVNGSLVVNDKNVENAIDSLQASTFTHTDTDSVDHYRLTWFTSSGGNRNVDIPTYTGKNFNSIEDAMDPNTGGSFLADGGLIEDLLDYIDQYIDSKI